MNSNEPRRNSKHPKITLYRILVVVSTAGFGLSKALLAYKGQSTAPNTLDWLYGVVVFLMLYWLGIYEKHALHNKPWLYETDYLQLTWKMVAYPLGKIRRHRRPRRS